MPDLKGHAAIVKRQLNPQASLAELSAHDPKGSWAYACFFLLDPNSPDMNFSTIGHSPYLYYVRLNCNNVLKRVLFRQPVKLTTNQ